MGERRDAYIVLVGKPGGNRSLGRSRYRREDNIKMDFQELYVRGVGVGAGTGLIWCRIGTGGELL